MPNKGSKLKHRRHGLVALRRALKGAIDPKSALGLALAEMRSALLADVGIVDQSQASESQRGMVELAIRTHVRWAAIEAWLDEHLAQHPESLLDGRVLAIVREGRAAGSALADHLLALRDPRLARREPAVSWEEQIAAICAEPSEPQDGPQEQEQDVDPSSSARAPSEPPAGTVDGQDEQASASGHPAE